MIHVRQKWERGLLIRFEKGCEMIGIEPAKAEAMIRAGRFPYPVHTGENDMRVFEKGELLAAIKGRNAVNDLMGDLISQSPPPAARRENRLGSLSPHRRTVR